MLLMNLLVNDSFNFTSLCFKRPMQQWILILKKKLSFKACMNSRVAICLKLLILLFNLLGKSFTPRMKVKLTVTLLKENCHWCPKQPLDFKHFAYSIC